MYPKSRPSPEVQEAVRQENQRCAEFIERGIQRSGLDSSAALTVLGNLIAMRASCVYKDASTTENVRKAYEHLEKEMEIYDQIDARAEHMIDEG